MSHEPYRLMREEFERQYAKLATMDSDDDWVKDYIFNGWRMCWEFLNSNKDPFANQRAVNKAETDSIRAIQDHQSQNPLPDGVIATNGTNKWDICPHCGSTWERCTKDNRLCYGSNASKTTE